MISKSEGLMLLFLLRADEFYILTRCCYHAFFQYLTFRLAHHTIEYYLKSGLSAYVSMNAMRRLGHNLDKLWEKYEAHVGSLDVDVRIISHINRFETMRYPGGSKFVRTLWGVSYDELFTKVFDEAPEDIQSTLACFSLGDFDKIVHALRTSLPDGDRLPFVTATDDAETYLYGDNKYFSPEGT